jgi:hypothetical protein
MINLRMERRSEPYKAPKVKPFGGAGQRLGEVVPNVVMGGAAAAAASTAMTNVETAGNWRCIPPHVEITAPGIRY